MVAPGGTVRIRADSSWNVPEPELTLAIDRAGRIFGYTIGNDMSSRDIEGENPLYLPQAKTYDGSCALGAEVLVRDAVPDPATRIEMEIVRDGAAAFSGATTLAEAESARPQELASFLYRHNTFPDGCFLMTGTGIVPPDGFTLQAGDRVTITIESIGTLINTVGGFGAAGLLTVADVPDAHGGALDSIGDLDSILGFESPSLPATSGEGTPGTIPAHRAHAARGAERQPVRPDPERGHGLAA